MTEIQGKTNTMINEDEVKSLAVRQGCTDMLLSGGYGGVSPTHTYLLVGMSVRFEPKQSAEILECAQRHLKNATSCE